MTFEEVDAYARELLGKKITYPCGPSSTKRSGILRKLAVGRLEGKRQADEDPANGFDGLPDRRLFWLDPDRYNAFVKGLDCSPCWTRIESADEATAVLEEVNG